MLESGMILGTIARNMDTIKKYGVARIGLFGSFARDTNNEESDVDILVDFNDGYVNIDNYMELKFFLEDLFKRKVDLVRSCILKSKIRENVMRSVIYAEKQ